MGSSVPGVGSAALSLSDCIAFSAAALFAAPGAPGERPDGWSAPPASDLVEVTVEGLHCVRVAVGPFERGPLHLVFEWHSNARAPPTCVQGEKGATQVRVLAMLLIDDDAVVAYLRDAYAMPVRTASFVASDTSLGAAEQHEWSWHEGDQAESRIAIHGDAATGPEDTLYRLFWSAGRGLASLDVSSTGTGSTGERVGYGSFQPPMLLANAGSLFAGTAEWFPVLDQQGMFTVYSDTSCQAAVP